MKRITVICYFLLFFCLMACNHKPVNKEITDYTDTSFNVNNLFDINDTLPGRTVMEMNNDSTPKVVYFYRVDENGTLTSEKTREAYYFPGHKKYIEGDFNHNQRNGEWFAYFENGRVNTHAFYVDGKENGEYAVYRENGKPYYIGYYKMGICTGEWKFYDENGTVIKKMIADENTIVCNGCEKCKKLRNKNELNK